MNNYIKILVNHFAELSDISLTDDHLKILNYAYDYYELHKVGPLYQNIAKNTGYTQADLESIFPHGLSSVYFWVGIPIQTTDDICKQAVEIRNLSDYREVYLDHNGTTYLRKEVKKALLNHLNNDHEYGNPSSSTVLGKMAHGILQTSRLKIAKCLKVKRDEILFTGGGSEANNLAIKGIAFKHLENKGHIVTSQIEHNSVLKTVQFLETIGFSASYISPDKSGIITAEAVKKEIKSDTLLIAVMAVNNELGTITPIGEIGRVCAERKIPFLVDGVQAFGKLRIHPRQMGISLLSISGHKIYAPKGVGALYVDKDIDLLPLIHGGEQEYGYRAGTENLASILAFGKAAELMYKSLDREHQRLSALKKFFIDELYKIEPDCCLNGSLEHQLPSSVNVGFPGIDSGALLLSLNQIGIYVSSGSACNAGSKESSHVLTAIGVDQEKYGSIRFSLGIKTTREDLEYLFKYLPELLSQLKE